MIGRVALVAIFVASAGTATADNPEAKRLSTEGEEAARIGSYEKAIALFKQADAIEKRPHHACLIGLAYTRLERLAQAEIFLGRCRIRGSQSDPAPSWLVDAEQQLAAKIQTIDVAAIEIVVEPAGAAHVASIKLSGMPPDEDFAPRTIHLRPGTHVATVDAPGFVAATATLVVEQPTTGTKPRPQRVVVPMKTRAEVDQQQQQPPPPPPPPPAVTENKQRKLGKPLMIGGAAAAGVGMVFHILTYRERVELVEASNDDNVMRYDDHEGKFDTYRAVTFAFYGVAVAAGAIGAYLHFTSRDDDEKPRVGGVIGPDGGLVTVEWRR